MLVLGDSLAGACLKKFDVAHFIAQLEICYGLSPSRRQILISVADVYVRACRLFFFSKFVHNEIGRNFNWLLTIIHPWSVQAILRVMFLRGKYSCKICQELSQYMPLHPNVGGPGLVGGCQLSDGSIEEWLRPGEEDLVQRFDPSSPLDTIGFFVAKFNVGPKDD